MYELPPPIPSVGDDKVDSEDFLLPSVILWNPLLSYTHIFPPGSIKCFDCGKMMHGGYWNDGSSAARQPRTLQGIGNVVLLVSAVYVCDNRHRLLAHDKIVLDKFPTSSMIPFLLLHRTGFTRDLVDMCISVCRRGINFYNLESDNGKAIGIVHQTARNASDIVALHNKALIYKISGPLLNRNRQVMTFCRSVL